MSRLDDLVGRFLATVDDAGHPITTATGDVEVELILDGRQYFTELFEAIEATGPGDQVLLLGWTFDPDMRRPQGRAMGDLLADKQHVDGVQVHVVLNGSFFNRVTSYNPFAQSLAALRDLRTQRIPPGAAAPPLDRQVLFDFSGAAITASHHQKVAVIRRGDDTVAYVGGVDLWPDRDDTPDHPGTVLVKDGRPWGWHDAVMRLRGAPVADVWGNFVSRWEETRTLPERSAWYKAPDDLVPSWTPFNPDPAAPAPPPPLAFTAQAPTPDVAVQVLRSRLPSKLFQLVPAADTTGFETVPMMLTISPWQFPPLGGIRQVYATLTRALDAAERYVYIEDQFVGDSLGGEAGYSLLGHLVEAAKRDVKIIVVTTGQGRADGPVQPAPPGYGGRLIGDLPEPQKSNVAIWRLTDLMVHSKMIFIDDVFCAVGSANLQSRSMFGVDQELHVAVVDGAVDGSTPAGVVRDWRVQAWAEHLEIGDDYAAVRPQLEALDLALGMWRASWLVGGTPGMWFSGDNPPGFAPARIRRTFFGPPPMEG